MTSSQLHFRLTLTLLNAPQCDVDSSYPSIHLTGRGIAAAKSAPLCMNDPQRTEIERRERIVRVNQSGNGSGVNPHLQQQVVKTGC
jgi:hypothetical protein